MSMKHHWKGRAAGVLRDRTGMSGRSGRCGIRLMVACLSACLFAVACGLGGGKNAGTPSSAEVARFEAIKAKIDSGERYYKFDTPIDGLLSYASALARKSPADLRAASARRFSSARAEEIPAHILAMYRGLSVGRTPPYASEVKEGDVHPIYVTYSGNVKGIEVFIYRDKGWRQLFNDTAEVPDWRAAAERAKAFIEPGLPHDNVDARPPQGSK